MRALSLPAALTALALLLSGCGTTDPGGLANITGRWTYARWEFDDPDGLIDYIASGTGTGSLEIRPDSTFLLEEFAVWVAGPRVQRLEGRVELDGDRLSLVFAGGTWQYDARFSGDMLLLERIGERPAPSGEGGDDPASELIGLLPDLDPPVLSGRIAFTVTAPGIGTDIFVMNADGTGRVRLTDAPGIDSDPSWSPDGSRIAFMSERDGNREIYVMNEDGSNQVRLTDDPAEDRSPDWGPDGRIAFSRNPATEPASIHVMAPDGSGIVRARPADARPGVNHLNPAWKPDGSRIAYSFGGSASEIHSMRPDGTDDVELVVPAEAFGAAEVTPAWSPAGISLAYVHWDHWATLVIQGAESRVGGGRQPAYPKWITDDAVLFDSMGDIYVVRASGRGIANLTRTASAEESMPDWAP